MRALLFEDGAWLSTILQMKRRQKMMKNGEKKEESKTKSSSGTGLANRPQVFYLTDARVNKSAKIIQQVNLVNKAASKLAIHNYKHCSEKTAVVAHRYWAHLRTPPMQQEKETLLTNASQNQSSATSSSSPITSSNHINVIDADADSDDSGFGECATDIARATIAAAQAHGWGRSQSDSNSNNNNSNNSTMNMPSGMSILPTSEDQRARGVGVITGGNLKEVGRIIPESEKRLQGAPNNNIAELERVSDGERIPSDKIAWKNVIFQSLDGAVNMPPASSNSKLPERDVVKTSGSTCTSASNSIQDSNNSSNSTNTNSNNNASSSTSRASCLKKQKTGNSSEKQTKQQVQLPSVVHIQPAALPEACRMVAGQNNLLLPTPYKYHALPIAGMSNMGDELIMGCDNLRSEEHCHSLELLENSLLLCSGEGALGVHAFENWNDHAHPHAASSSFGPKNNNNNNNNNNSSFSVGSAGKSDSRLPKKDKLDRDHRDFRKRNDYSHAPELASILISVTESLVSDADRFVKIMDATSDGWFFTHGM